MNTLNRELDQLLTVNGQQLYVRLIEKYSGRPTIIFLHDSLGCTSLWRDFPSVLCDSTQCNMVVYDRRGYGLSAPMPGPERTNLYMHDEADTLINLLSELNIEQPILFGHSDGASIALIAAGKYPATFSAVIAEAGHVLVEQITLNGIKDAVVQFNNTDLQIKLEKYHGNKTETLFRAWTETWLSETFSTWNIEQLLPSIICPVLVIQGEADEYGSIKQVEAISAKASGEVEVYMIPGTGHTPHKERREEVLQRTIGFVNELSR